MVDPIIHVIPEAYYGGAVPKKVLRKEIPLAGSSAVSTSSVKSSRNKWIVIAIIGGLFLMVLGGAIWYFTRGLRPVAQSPAPVAPVVETPVPVEPPLATPEVPVSPEPQPVLPTAPTPSSDTDNDGLTQAEEGLYGSEHTVPDTDGDGFLDGHEVVNLYNPSGIAPEKLEATGFVTRFKHQTYSYELLYPKTWQLLPDASARELSFQSATGESIAVSIIDNPQQQTPAAFATSTAQGATITDWTTNKANVSGVLIEEAGALRGVFGNRNFLYVVQYPLPQAGAGAYRRTFEMMLNSLRIMN